MDHPFLQDDFHIRWSQLTPDHIEPDIAKALEEAGAAVEAVAARGGLPGPELDYGSTFGALDAALEPLNRAWGKVGHLDSVCNSPELRKAHNAMLPAVSDFFAGIPLNAKLWQALKAFGESDAVDALSPARKRHVGETLADFREQGADLDADGKAKAREIQRELAELTQKYSENVLDATNAWEKIVTDEAELAGLPESARAAALENARQKGHGSDEAPAWRLTLQAPSLIPVLTYADSDALRREVWEAYDRLASGDPHDNRPLVPRILELRRAFARLVGRDHFPDLVTARRMVGSGAAALRFIGDLHDRIESAFMQDTEELRSFKAKATGQASALLEPWEAGYWAEKQRRAGYDFDEEELRPFFPIDPVINGLFDIAQQLFGLRIEEREARFGAPQADGTDLPEVWHPEVKFYDLFDAADDRHLGSFYADWHPRESKRSGAWMNYLLTGARAAETAHSPHLGLICGNLSPATGGKPALLTHDEVQTLFHEFGHLLHHLCGEVEVKSLNGVNVAWDFVELPSQILENWCWEREGLDLFARHYESGQPIPGELFEKMVAARNFRAASATMRQLSFGKLDLELHLNWNGETDLEAFADERLSGYLAEYRTRPRPNLYHFGHLFSGPTGYASGYYSYKWAEVLDADAFTRFKAEGVLNPDTGRDFRRAILSRGNAAEPAELFRDFMGRDPDPDALLRRDGLLT